MLVLLVCSFIFIHLCTCIHACMHRVRHVYAMAYMCSYKDNTGDLVLAFRHVSCGDLTGSLGFRASVFPHRDISPDPGLCVCFLCTSRVTHGVKTGGTNTLHADLCLLCFKDPGGMTRTPHGPMAPFPSINLAVEFITIFAKRSLPL